MKTRKNIAFALIMILLISNMACKLTSASEGQASPTPHIMVTPIATAVIQTATIPTSTPPATLPASPLQPTPGGNVYYVAANQAGASDDNNGLYPAYQGGADGPWLTIQYAADQMVAGDTTQVRAGTYFEAGVTFTNSGQAGAPITLASYPDEEVILDGSKNSREELPGIYIKPGQGHYVIQGLAVRKMSWSGIATDDDTSQPYADITIRDCTLYDNHWSGIDLSAVDGFLVENVNSFQNGYYGLDIISSKGGGHSSANGVVQNSSFHDHTGKEGHGLAINQGHDIVIRDNVAYHNTIHGFDASDWPKGSELTYNVTFERNFSYDNGVNGFAINSDSHHVLYHNNIAWRNGAEWAGHGSASGFNCYEGCWHVEWYNNVSAENSDAGFWVEDQFGSYSTPGDNLLVYKNNIAYQNRYGALVVEGENTWNVVAEYNDWYPPPGEEEIIAIQGKIFTVSDINNGAWQVGNISIDPMFVDPAAHDFHLQPASPLLDRGMDIGLPFCGKAPDMGAYEICP